jgi:hypothetical protein
MIGMRRFNGYAEAISKIYPTAQWAIRDNDYDQLDWISTDIPKPNKDELDQKIIDLDNNEPTRCMREIRDWYLQQSDWTQGADIRNIRGTEWCAKWDAYRQELRNMTENYTPRFGPMNELLDVVWPTSPNEK